jgi:hypothetical protein
VSLSIRTKAISETSAGKVSIVADTRHQRKEKKS